MPMLIPLRIQLVVIWIMAAWFSTLGLLELTTNPFHTFLGLGMGTGLARVAIRACRDGKAGSPPHDSLLVAFCHSQEGTAVFDRGFQSSNHVDSRVSGITTDQWGKLRNRKCPAVVTTANQETGRFRSRIGSLIEIC